MNYYYYHYYISRDRSNLQVSADVVHQSSQVRGGQLAHDAQRVADLDVQLQQRHVLGGGVLGVVVALVDVGGGVDQQDVFGDQVDGLLPIAQETNLGALFRLLQVELLLFLLPVAVQTRLS